MPDLPALALTAAGIIICAAGIGLLVPSHTRRRGLIWIGARKRWPGWITVRRDPKRVSYQQLVDSLPFPAAVFTPHPHREASNELWAKTPVLSSEVAVRHVLKAADDAVGGQANEPRGAYLLSAARVDTRGHKFLVVASPREPLVHLVTALGDLAHEAPKKWRTLDALIQDVIDNGSRASWVQDYEYIEEFVRPAHAALRSILPRMAAVLSSQSEPLKLLSVGQLITAVIEDVRRHQDFTIDGPEYEKLAGPAMQVAVRPEGVNAIFRLLAENARLHGKATSAKLVIDRTAPLAPPSERGPLQQVLVTFVDNGKGIDPDLIEDFRQNDPFGPRPYRPGGEHLGQGLNLCHAFAIQNGGSLTVMEGAAKDGQPTNPHFRFADGRVGAWITLKLPVANDTLTSAGPQEG